jgi:hypothetical protein
VPNRIVLSVIVAPSTRSPTTLSRLKWIPDFAASIVL